MTAVVDVKSVDKGRGMVIIEEASDAQDAVYMMKVKVNRASKEVYQLIPKVDAGFSVNMWV